MRTPDRLYSVQIRYYAQWEQQCVFDNEREAQKAVQTYEDRGLRPEHIRVVVYDRRKVKP